MGTVLVWGDKVLTWGGDLPLLHSPADVTAQVLIDVLKLATSGITNPSIPVGDWPVYVSSEPSNPDNCITVQDTTPIDQGRSMPDGARLRHFGVQVRVRATTHRVGWTQAEVIRRGLDEGVYGATVTLDGTNYMVHCYSRTNGPLDLGRNVPSTKRSIFTINTTVALRRLT